MQAKGSSSNKPGWSQNEDLFARFFACTEEGLHIGRKRRNVWFF